MKNSSVSRRRFLGSSAGLLTGLSLPVWAHPFEPTADSPHIIGPMEGYSPQVGTMLSMMNWMRDTVLRDVKGLTQPELDFLFDDKANTIGSLLLHLAAVEVYYQINTFEGRSEPNEAELKKWGAAMELDKAARQVIKGNDLAYYVNILTEVREKTKAEFRKRDDAWLMKVDPKFFAGQPTNNYCKWFHVCEHESNHNGQIRWIRKRLPQAQASKK